MLYRLGEIRTHDRSGDRYWVQGSCKSNYQAITTTKVPLRTTELDIVELDTSGNYRHRTSQ